MLTTGGMNQAPFAVCGPICGRGEQQIGEDDAHGEGEREADDREHGDGGIHRVGGAERRPNRCDAHGQHEQAAGERSVQGTGDGVAEVRDGRLGVTKPAHHVGHAQSDRQDRRRRDECDAKGMRRILQPGRVSRVLVADDADDRGPHDRPEPAGVEAPQAPEWRDRGLDLSWSD